MYITGWPLITISAKRQPQCTHINSYKLSQTVTRRMYTNVYKCTPICSAISTARPQSSSLDTGNQAGTAEDRDILERCQLPLRRLRTFLCVDDRAICTSSHSPTNLSLLWSEIRRVDGSVHHHPSSYAALQMQVNQISGVWRLRMKIHRFFCSQTAV